MSDIKSRKFKYIWLLTYGMERKLINQGKGGLTLYLPKKWADRKGLKGGDSVQIAETETELVISCRTRGKYKIEVNVSDDNRHDFYVLLSHCYRRGFDTIEFKGVTSSDVEKIKTLTHDLLLGFEVIETRKTSITIGNVSEPSGEKYEPLVQRLFFILKETNRVVLEDFRRGVFDNPKELLDLRTQQDKFVFFCKRILSREKTKGIVLGWELLTWLLHIQHGYDYLYKYACKHPVKQPSRIIELLEAQSKDLDLYSLAYLNKDIKAIHTLNVRKNTYLYGKNYEYLEKSTGAEAVVLAQLWNISRTILIAQSPILAEILEKSM